MTRSRLLFAGAVFLGSFLLFLVEPIAAKQLLPVSGWVRRCVDHMPGLLPNRTLGRLPLCALDGTTATVAALFRFASGWVRVGGELVRTEQRTWRRIDTSHPHRICCAWQHHRLPFLVLGTTSPLMQVWRARMTGGIPYRLFALSNLASLLALGLYPTLIEPRFTLRAAHWLVLWLCVVRGDHWRTDVEGAVGGAARRRMENRGRGEMAAPPGISSFGCCCRWGQRCSCAR